MNNVVVFLDFDGVTHSQPLKGLEFANLHIIESVLREYPDVDVVISSTWREQYTLGELRDYFSHDIRDRIVGVTPFFRSPKLDWTPGNGPKWERQWEIETWMERNRPEAAWLAIDDYEPLFKVGCPNLLITNPKFGFHLDQADDLRDMIEGLSK